MLAYSHRGKVLYGKVLLLDNSVVAACDGYTHKVSEPHVHTTENLHETTSTKIREGRRNTFRHKIILTHKFRKASPWRIRKDKTGKCKT